MNTAFEIRNQLLGNNTDVFAAQKSNYNPNVYLYKCEICNYKPSLKTDIPLETHHIHFQSCANSLGHFKELGFHKNVEHNLVCLCRNCHTNVHNGMLNIKGYISTNAGVVLDFEKNEIVSLSTEPTKTIHKNSAKRKLSQTQLEIVQNIIKNNKNKNKKIIITELELNHAIKIDYKILSKIENNNY